jgi:uncharacterized protein
MDKRRGAEAGHAGYTRPMSGRVLPRPIAPFHVMTKAIGPLCNLGCSYCYYLEKERLFPANERFRMADDVLETFVRDYIAAQNTPEVTFAWQGGEPTLLGRAFFERVVELQQRYAGGKRIANALQTNGTLLDDAWCGFFRRHRFLVGLSVDGPQELHDAYRTDKLGRPTWERVMAGLALLRKHRVDFNTLTVVNRRNSQHALTVYRFLREHGSGFMQFIPLVERRPRGETGGTASGAPRPSLTFAPPPEFACRADCVAPAEADAAVSEETVRPAEWGAFLCTIFEEWVRRDVGRVFVQLFDTALGQWMGRGSALCVFAETCGRGLALEHNGDVFACDHYVYPRWRLGNLAETPLADLVDSPAQRAFGAAKQTSLPRQCRECPVKFACQGECPKHRFVLTGDGEPGLSYLCEGYRRFFTHIAPAMSRMAALVNAGRPAADLMGEIAARERAARVPVPGSVGSRVARVARNEPCPCGSGRKFKRCCGCG